MKIKILFFGILIASSLQHGYAQKNHAIEPCVMEVSYHLSLGKMRDNFALRIGKNASQYFSYDELRDDSLGSNPETAMIILNEMLDEARNRQDQSKQRAASPGHGDYLYRNLDKGSFTTYTQDFDSHYRIVEAVPVQSWSINGDSTQQIIGFICHMATTHFRGRDWKVWYSEEIPLALGPWKLSGLPGLILAAESKGFVSIKATGIKTKNLTPITFYNFGDKKFEDIERTVFLKVQNDPKSYPKNVIMTSVMELE